LTLARLKQFGLGKEVSEALGKTLSSKRSWTVSELCLYQSVLKPESAEYTDLHTVHLTS
jgi:2'-5' RNA ligase